MTSWEFTYCISKHFISNIKYFQSSTFILILTLIFPSELFLIRSLLNLAYPQLSFPCAVCAPCCLKVPGVNFIQQGINAQGSGSLVIADGNTDQRPLTVPWVFGLPLSASLHYKKMVPGSRGTQTHTQSRNFL